MRALQTATKQALSVGKQSTQRVLATSTVTNALSTVSTLSSSRSYATAPGVVPAHNNLKTDMFCFQCEQTKDTKGCTTVGVCGKEPTVAAMQDLLVHNLRNLQAYAYAAVQLGFPKEKLAAIDEFCLIALYSTLTNVNFDKTRFIEFLDQCNTLTKEVKQSYSDLVKQNTKTGLFSWFTGNKKNPETLLLNEFFIEKEVKNSDYTTLENYGKSINVQEKMATLGQEVGSIQELLQFGLKGYAAYAREAQLLGQSDQVVFDFMREAMAFLAGVEINGKKSTNLDDLLYYSLKCGEVNIRVMQLLDQGGNERFGTPTPAKVNCTPVPGKCILVSGHDLGDLEAILKQTEGKGINVYTHGELLPAHGYPKLKAYKHLVGNYGSAWQNQKFEFAKFPGSIVVTTNCIIEPRQQYKNRIFTTGAVGYEGVQHIKNRQFAPLIEAALKESGFTEEQCAKEKPQETMTGFGHKTVLSIAGHVVNGVKSGAIKRFFLIGGCDGAEADRTYYRDLATGLPQDNVILTLGCAKYRFNKLDFGTVTIDKDANGKDIAIPRLLDVGQCNDAYSAVVIASALAEVFGTKDLNQLPLSFAISWFEQKAVVIFLTLLHLGIQNIRIGPALPAFIPPKVLNVLVDKYKLHPIAASDVKNHMDQMLKGM